jgi:hypothetical protein
MLVVPGFEVLSDCRSTTFDAPGRTGKPRYRLVYLNEPDEGGIAVVCVLAAGEGRQTTADKQARARLQAKPRRQEFAPVAASPPRAERFESSSPGGGEELRPGSGLKLG